MTTDYLLCMHDHYPYIDRRPGGGKLEIYVEPDEFVRATERKVAEYREHYEGRFRSIREMAKAGLVDCGEFVSGDGGGSIF